VSPLSTRTPEPATGPWFFCLRHPAEAQCIRIAIIGELRLATASRARSVIRRAQDDAREVTCDLGDLLSIDAFGAYALVDAAARARHNGVRLTLVHSPPLVRRILGRLGLDSALGIDPPAPSPRGLPIGVRADPSSAGYDRTPPGHGRGGPRMDDEGPAVQDLELSTADA
jgi:anti-anti-sigma factor